MKAVFLIALIAVALAEDIEYYKTLGNYAELEANLDDPVILKQHIDCFIGAAPCSEIDNSFKSHLPEALVQACKRCSPAQKHLAHKFFDALKDTQPVQFDLLKKFVDPENKYFDAFIEAVSGY